MISIILLAESNHCLKDLLMYLRNYMENINQQIMLDKANQQMLL